MPLQLSLLLCNRSRKTYQNLSVQESHQEENAKIDAIRRLFPLSPSTPPGDAINPPRENETSRQCSNHRLADHDKLQRFQVTNDLIFKNKSILIAVTSRLLFPKTLLKNHPKKVIKRARAFSCRFRPPLLTQPSWRRLGLRTCSQRVQ